jgi:uncharacterized protein Yka (UPF0111/DUF47 family)
MAKKKDNFYFLGFIRLVDYSCQAADLLREIIYDYDGTKLSALKEKMHSIEHSADLEKHILIEKLVKEFITPIEREDIISIAQKIDDVTDAIEDVLLKLYMFNVQEIKDVLKEFTDVVCQCCQGLSVAVKEFYNFKHSNTLKDAIIEVNRLEEVGDRIYTEAVRKLFVESKDSTHLLIWEQMFYRFEKCCDSCEEVADAIETVIMKNR